MATDSPPLDSAVVVAPPDSGGLGAISPSRDPLAPPVGPAPLQLGSGAGSDGRLGSHPSTDTLVNFVDQTTLIASRVTGYQQLVETRLPEQIVGPSRARLASALVSDWHPATRDNYLAAFSAFVDWH